MQLERVGFVVVRREHRHTVQPRHGNHLGGLCGRRMHPCGRVVSFPRMMSGSVTTKSRLGLPHAFRLDRPAVQVHQLLADCESQPQPTVFPVGRAVSLREPLEHMRQEGGRIPIPVSLTLNSICEFTRCSRTWTFPPLGVNLTALLRRFQNTCCRRCGSP